MKIKIQSIVDVITNSSTEIYISADESGVAAIKNLINLFTNGKCDELFDIKIYSEYDDTDEAEYRYIDSFYTVTAKTNDDKDIKIAQILSSLEQLFNYNAEYNG